MTTATQSLSIRKGASRAVDPERAVDELHAALAPEPGQWVVFYCDATYDLERLGAAVSKRFAGTQVIGCTTAGEITPIGYIEGSLTGVSIGSPRFQVAVGRLDRLSEFEFRHGHELVGSLLRQLGKQQPAPGGHNTFGFLLIDGLSMREEAVVSALHQGLGSIELFGGSAGDGLRFGRTQVFHDGRFHTDAAVFALVQPAAPFEVFKTQHFVPSNQKMVVTKADPLRRIVTEINGEPAGREYARMVGLGAGNLTPMIFAAHPVVVRVGGHYYVRSIQKVNDDESLSFFCAIDEGVVLTVAQGVDLVQNLEELFAGIRARLGPPELVLGCDCILRNLEIGQRDLKERVGALLQANNVIGFATYGEQFNAMHVNQTFTGVAIGATHR